MDTALITCPECTKRFRGKVSLAGKKIKCPFCKDPFVVPKDIGVSIAVQEAKPEERKKITFDDEDDPGAYGVTALDLAPRCPNCANPMADEKAFICLYCGYNTLTREWGKTEKLFSHTTSDYVNHQMTGYICAGVALVLAITLVFLDLVFPFVLDATSWQSYLDHESMRLWITVFMLFIFWALGMVVYKRLVINPTPPENKKE